MTSARRILTNRRPLRQFYHKAVREAALLNTPQYGEAVRANPSYNYANNKTAPKKVGSALYLLDCLTLRQMRSRMPQ